jgi:uncharacterized protein YutE (UPF0331/DUF86 family)
MTLQEALARSSPQASKTDRTIAILLAGQAVEGVLRLVLDKDDIGGPRRGLGNLQQLAKEEGIEIRDREAGRSAADARAKLQHRGWQLDPETASSTVRGAFSFCEEVVAKLLHASLRDVGLADLVTHDWLSRPLKEAEIAIAAHDKRAAAVALSRARYRLVAYLIPKTQPSGNDARSDDAAAAIEDIGGIISDVPFEGARRLERARRWATSVDESMRSLIEGSVTGLSVSDLHRLERGLPICTEYVNRREVVTVRRGDPEPSDDFLSWCLSALTEASLRAQAGLRPLGEWEQEWLDGVSPIEEVRELEGTREGW